MRTKLIVFGLTGDLSRRKLLPALDEIVQAGQPGDLTIIGVSRRQVDISELLAGRPALVGCSSIFTMNLAQAEEYDRLRDYIALQPDEQALVYLSVPPSAAADIVDFLGQAGLNTPNVKLLFEKPFGFDYTSAKEYIGRTARYYDEANIYRVDHYLAKDVARRLIDHHVVASGGAWDGSHVAAIEIIASETIGVESRADFYEETGALRDFLQGHLLQLAALLLMDVKGQVPADDELPRYRLAALQQLEPADPTRAIRAQYQGYDQDVANPGSLTETFASLHLASDDTRWQGVDIHLVTGKKLNQKRSQVIITYRDGHQDVIEEPGDSQSAYLRVLQQAIEGHKAIFTTGPEILRAWQIVAPVLDTWGMDNTPLPLYPAGATIEQIEQR